ncbi:phosphotransferase system IIB component [Filimonas zeae]|nr:BON domain-containing protein [Filimonas zeae]MDR6341476.1 phosphotransferase system IIB component [Filimonas zeae]
MKRNRVAAFLMFAAMSYVIACKGKSDTDIQAAVAEKVNAIPGVMSETKDGVVTLSGTVTADSLKTQAEELTKSTDGVKGVTNTIVVAAPPIVTPAPPAPTLDTTRVTVSTDDQLKVGVNTVIKDYPGVSATVKDGVVTVKGETTASKWKLLKQSLDALTPKQVDASGLTVKQ